MSAATYTDDELISIEGWLLDGLSANQLAAAFTQKFRLVTRNAIIGIVLRNKTLHKIGFARSTRAGVKNQPKVPAAPRPVTPALKIQKQAALHSQNNVARKMAKQHLHPHNIVAKANSRQFDREMPKPAPTVFECRSVPLTKLKRGECRWAVNDAQVGETHLFCGNPSDRDRSYCPSHSAMAFQVRRAA